MADVNPVQAQKFLKGIDYPASKDEVVRHARDQGADQRVLDALQQVKMDRFNSPNDVSEALGQQS